MFATYRVQGKSQIVDVITNYLAIGGATIVSAPSPKTAPFHYKIRLPNGKHLDLIFYAFLANKYLQRRRPDDEHRFQIKYGSNFDRPHDIYISTDRDIVTLFLGVHLDEGIFVAADPWMHNPTWFSSSVEFKSPVIEAAKARGWYGWERARSDTRRRVGKESANFQTESLIAFTPDKLVQYVQFEQIATGMDAGERLLLAERIFDHPVDIGTAHPLEEQFGMSAQQVLDVISARFRLNVAVRGAVAEYHLENLLKATSQLSEVRSIDEDGQPDFHLVYRDTRFLIECKNVLRKTRSDGHPKVDFQKTRAAKGNPCSRYYERSAFDVLAACLHPVNESWDFRFALTCQLDAHPTCADKLSHNVAVGGSRWTNDIVQLLDRYVEVQR